MNTNKINLEATTNKELTNLFPELPMQHRYNIMEASLNKHLQEFKGDRKAEAERIEKLLPTQVVRSGSKESLQQYSTPASIAHLMTELLDPQPDDIVLEPSAGTGNLLRFLPPVKEIYANEIDEHRRNLLNDLGYKTTAYNAEFINDLLPAEIKPNKIIMNPPFSAGLKTTRNKTQYGFNHLNQALQRLEYGGTLVCLLGESSMNHIDQFRRILVMVQGVSILENYKISGKEYYKNGTTTSTNIIVFKKNKEIAIIAKSIDNLTNQKEP